MRFICIGAGAIGTYVGGSLQAAGHDVTFVERPEAIERLKAQGMTIVKADGATLRLERIDVVPTVADALEKSGNSAPYDAVIFAVKSFNTEEILRNLEPLKEQLPPFIALQNGVENEAKLRSVLGPERVIPVSVCTAIARTDRGAIQVSKLRGIGIAAGFPLSADLCAAFTGAGLKAKLIAHADGMKWSKMISNLLSNAASAILNMTPAEVYRDADLYALERRQILETVRVMDAYNIPVVDIPGVPVRLLVWVFRAFPSGVARKILTKAIGGGRGSKMPSFHIDLYSGSRENEVEFLNGAIVRFGKAKKIPTPVNALYYDTLMALTMRHLPVDEFDHQPAKFMDYFVEKITMACPPSA